jgi:hypothetical protein
VIAIELTLVYQNVTTLYINRSSFVSGISTLQDETNHFKAIPCDKEKPMLESITFTTDGACSWTALTLKNLVVYVHCDSLIQNNVGTRTDLNGAGSGILKSIL